MQAKSESEACQTVPMQPTSRCAHTHGHISHRLPHDRCQASRTLARCPQRRIPAADRSTSLSGRFDRAFGANASCCGFRVAFEFLWQGRFANITCGSRRAVPHFADGGVVRAPACDPLFVPCPSVAWTWRIASVWVRCALRSGPCAIGLQTVRAASGPWSATARRRGRRRRPST